MREFSLAPRLPNVKTSFENGRAGMIRATGAVLIASALLYFLLRMVISPIVFQPEQLN